MAKIISNYNRKNIYFILLFIILLSINITIIPRLSTFAPQYILSIDSGTSLIRAKYILEHHQVDLVSFESWSVRWKNTTRPIGFPILSAEFSMISHNTLYSVGFFSIIYIIIEIILIFLLSQKIFYNKWIDLLSAFFMGTYISGSASQGPLYSHYANIGFIFIILIFILFFSKVNYFKKMILISLFVAGVIITHRPSFVVITIFTLGVIIYYALLLVSSLRYKPKKKIYIFNISTFLGGFILGFFESSIYWYKIPFKSILLFGYNERILETNTIPSFLKIFINILYDYSILFITLLVIILFIIMFSIYLKRERVQSEIDLFSSKKFKFLTNLFIPLIVEVGFYTCLLLYLINILNISIKTFLTSPIRYWLTFSSIAHSYRYPTIQKMGQILYLWHLNITPLFFIIPTFLYIFKNFKLLKNKVGLLTFLVIIIAMIFLSQFLFNYLNIMERFYLYTAPFIYILISFLIFTVVIRAKDNYHNPKISKNQTSNSNLKSNLILIGLLFLFLSNIILYSGVVTLSSPLISDDRLATILYSKNNIMVNKVIISTRKEANCGNIVGYERYRISYPYIGTAPPHTLYKRYIRIGGSYIWIYTYNTGYQGPFLVKEQYLDYSNLAYKIFINNKDTLFYLGG